MSSFVLKLLALILMVIDHVGYFFIRNEYYIYFRYIGRLAMPIFFFLFVEGFIKTSNKKKHFWRLILYSFIMFLGNAIFYFILPYHYPFKTNIIFSMLVCYGILWILETDTQIWMKIFSFIILYTFSYFVEYSFLVVILSLIFYAYLTGKLNKPLFSIIYIVSSLTYCYFLSPKIQWFMIFSLPFMLLYNRKQGYKSKILQHGFYILYILHLWFFLILKNFGFVIK